MEETLLRATLVERDVWAREVLFKLKPLTAEQTRRKKEIWACSINASMVSPRRVDQVVCVTALAERRPTD